MAFMSRAQESRCWALACSTERSRVSTPQLRNSQFPINSQNETPKTPKTPKRRKLPKLPSGENSQNFETPKNRSERWLAACICMKQQDWGTFTRPYDLRERLLEYACAIV